MCLIITFALHPKRWYMSSTSMPMTSATAPISTMPAAVVQQDGWIVDANIAHPVQVCMHSRYDYGKIGDC